MKTKEVSYATAQKMIAELERELDNTLDVIRETRQTLFFGKEIGSMSNERLLYNLAIGTKMLEIAKELDHYDVDEFNLRANVLLDMKKMLTMRKQETNLSEQLDAYRKYAELFSDITKRAYVRRQLSKNLKPTVEELLS